MLDSRSLVQSLAAICESALRPGGGPGAPETGGSLEHTNAMRTVTHGVTVRHHFGIRARHAQPCARRDKKKPVCSRAYTRSAMLPGAPCRRQATKQQPGRRMPDTLQPAAFRCAERAAAGRQVEGSLGTRVGGNLAGENGEREPPRRLSTRSSARSCSCGETSESSSPAQVARALVDETQRAAPQLRRCDATR